MDSLAAKRVHMRLNFRKNEDVALLRLVRQENPFLNPEKWEMIQETMKQLFEERAFTRRGVKERCMYLLQVYKHEDKRSLNRGGTEDEYREQEALIESIIVMARHASFQIPRLPETRRARLTRVSTALAAALKIANTKSLEHWEDSSDPANSISEPILIQGWVGEDQSLDVEDHSNAMTEVTPHGPEVVYSPCGSVANYASEHADAGPSGVETDYQRTRIPIPNPKLEALQFLERRKEWEAKQRLADQQLEARRLDLMEQQLRLDSRRLDLEERRMEEDRTTRQMEQQRFWKQMEHLRQEHASLLKIVMKLVAGKNES